MGADSILGGVSGVQPPTNGINTLLRFKLQPDSLHSILYDLQTAEELQWFICDNVM